MSVNASDSNERSFLLQNAPLKRNQISCTYGEADVANMLSTMYLLEKIVKRFRKISDESLTTECSDTSEKGLGQICLHAYDSHLRPKMIARQYEKIARNWLRLIL